MVPPRLQVLSILLMLAFLSFLLYRFARGRLNLHYSILWFTLAGLGVLITVFPPLLQGIAVLLGIEVPSNALFFIGFVFIALLFLQLTSAICRLERQNKELCQELALVRHEIEEINPGEGTDRIE